MATEEKIPVYDTGLNTALPAQKIEQPFSPKRQRIIHGWYKEFVESLIRFRLFRIARTRLKKLSEVIIVLRRLDSLRRQVSGESRIKKMVKVDGRYYWDLYIPGFPSVAFDRFFEAEIQRISRVVGSANRFTNVFVAITKKCALQCEHCFEWDALNGKEKLTLSDLQGILANFNEVGTSQVQLTGGEPLLRINDLLLLLASAPKNTDYWVLTSGHQLTSSNASRLKAAGLTGVVISLDHYEPEFHNLFRGSKNSFEWVQQAVKNAIDNKLVTALSICVTRAFVSEKNLRAYMELAKKMGVSFVQILEPKAVGHYAGKDVSLAEEHIQLLEEFYLRMNYEKEFREYPLVTYHGYHQRRLGCFGSGNRNLYVDTDGDIHSCPFCQKKAGSALTGNLHELAAALQVTGCHGFKSAGL